ncbi:MAG: holo-ACP synthase [Lentisphaeria bacterium]|nr:holo-ACP synthase [Lentisphaeria bacterium]
MQILGLGTDIVEINRIEKLLAAHPGRFEERICTPQELASAGTKRGRVTFFAGRWAAKEAAAKALGCGIGKNCAFTDISVINDAAGKPEMSFTGAAAATAAACGVKNIRVSISHEAHYAVATVILSD